MNTFSIDYGSGHIAVNVNNYFVKADLTSIKKFFKLARDFCTNKQKNELADAISKSKTYWEQRYEKRNKNYGVESEVVRLLTPSTPLQMTKLKAKLDRVIEILALENWRNEKSEH